jgi:membrane protein DedA with SNARE-associated domain
MEFASLSDALVSLIPTYGPWIIFGVVAFESAGVPLPGETILVAAALLAATTGQINILVVVLGAATGAIVGDGLGYMVGRRLGLPFLRRYGRYIRLDEDRLLIGRYLFFRYGNAVVFFGRFIAVLRMFTASGPSRRRVRNASAVLKNFVRRPEETFATVSGVKRSAPGDRQGVDGASPSR